MTLKYIKYFYLITNTQFFNLLLKKQNDQPLDFVDFLDHNRITLKNKTLIISAIDAQLVG